MVSALRFHFSLLSRPHGSSDRIEGRAVREQRPFSVPSLSSQENGTLWGWATSTSCPWVQGWPRGEAGSQWPRRPGNSSLSPPPRVQPTTPFSRGPWWFMKSWPWPLPICALFFSCPSFLLLLGRNEMFQSSSLRGTRWLHRKKCGRTEGPQTC